MRQLTLVVSLLARLKSAPDAELAAWRPPRT